MPELVLDIPCHSASRSGAFRPDRPTPMSGPQRGITEPQPTAIEERRRLRKAKQRRFVIWVSGASIVILVAAIGTVGTAIVSSFASADEPARTPLGSEPAAFIEFPDDVPAAANGAEPCTTVTVMSSFENAEMVGNLAAGYNAQPRDIDGHCVVVSAVRDKSGVAAEAAAAGFPNIAPEARPIVWLPDSYTWLALARADGATAVPDIAVQASVVDTKGQLVDAAPVSVTVRDSVAPTVKIDRRHVGYAGSRRTADHGRGVGPGCRQRPVVDVQGDGRRSLDTDTPHRSGTAVDRDVVHRSGAGSAKPPQSLILDATAEDRAGNVGAAARVILPVADNVPRR